MKVQFFKYQGAGNDFIMIDNRQLFFPKNDTNLIAGLCNRNFGIGADGLILVERSALYDFKMVYYNADGNEGSMCGNGGRCAIAFANRLGIIKGITTFEAFDGLHDGSINKDIVSLKMLDVSIIETFDDNLFLDTGSPHHINYVADVAATDVYNLGKTIRYGAPYFDKGTNVNFVEQEDANTFKVRTYERGVENETLSCGTGVTAVALASHFTKRTDRNKVQLITSGGRLEVSFEKTGKGYRNIFLTGAATFVFQGEISIDI